MVYYFTTSSADRSAYEIMMRPLAQKYEEYLTFVTVDASEYADMLPRVGLAPGVTPALSLQNPRKGQVFPYDQGKHITWAAIQAFIVDISTGKVAPWDGTPPRTGAAEHDEL
jgi:protein disulfide-isomerase A1